MKNKQAIRFLRLFLCLILCLILSSSPFQMISLAYADNGDGIEIDNTGDEESDEETSDEETTDEESDEEDSDGDGISDAEEEEYKDQLDDLKDKQDELQDQQDELDGLISSAKSQKEAKQLVARNLGTQISLTRDQIALLEEKITLTGKYIREKEQEIADKEAVISDTMDLFRQRIRAVYMTGGYSDSGSSMIMLLSSDSIAEFLTNVEVLRRISVHDQDIVTQLRDDLAELEQEKAELDEEKAGLESDQKSLEEQTSSLQVNLAAANEAVEDLAAMQAEYEANREAIQAQMDAVQDEIAAIYAAYRSTNTEYIGGEMYWPVPGFSSISSYYGWRFNHTDFHTGVDITGSGIYGHDVIAATTGTVMYTNYCNKNGYGYGYGTYIIIDHGGGISTLYGHLSDIYVEQGDIVAAGEAIGAVGSTGWSTGPHLHFEVRIDGEDVNPLPYIT
jgi:murein DD-endopeptidase MepM/ murein hydrolase activator NlpD